MDRHRGRSIGPNGSAEAATRSGTCGGSRWVSTAPTTWATGPSSVSCSAVVGAGGISALRADDAHDRRARVLAVLVASLYALVLVRVAGAITLLSAPVFPFTALGAADHLAERRQERAVLPARE